MNKVLISILIVLVSFSGLNSQDKLNYPEIEINLKKLNNELINQNLTDTQLYNEISNFNSNPNPENLRTATYQIYKYYKRLNQIDSALFFLLQSWEIAKDIDSDTYFIEYFPEIPNFYWEIGDFNNALENALFSKSYFESKNDTLIYPSLYNLFGLIHRELNDFELAEENFLKSIYWCEVTESIGLKGVVYANLGNLNYLHQKYYEALKYLRKGVEIEKEHFSKSAAGRSYTTIGKVFQELDMIDSARYYLNKGKNYGIESNDNTGLSRNYVASGILEKYLSNYTKAIEYFDSAIYFSELSGTKLERYIAYEELSDTYAKLGDYKNSYTLKTQAFELHKEIYNVRKLLNVKQAEHEIKISKKENEYQIAQEKQEKRQLFIITLSIAILLIILSFFYLSLRSSKKKVEEKNKEIEKQKDELLKLNVKIDEARKKIEESDNLKTEFLKNISHEIRTPLNGILGFSSIIATEYVSEEERLQYYDEIKGNSKDLLKTIENIVDLAQIASNQIEVNISKFDLHQFLTDIQEATINDLPELKRDKLKIYLHLGNNQTAYFIQSDPTKLRKILNLLLDNSVKFTDEGYIEFGYTENAKSITLFVSDTGIGIHKKDLNNIFDSFRQANTGLSRAYGGTGTGLTIVKGLVDSINGNLWIESTVEKGTSIYFEIPV